MNPRISIVAPRLDAKPWGGRRLSQFGIDLPADERIGEALVTAGDAIVTSGYGTGSTLDEILSRDVEGHVGRIALAATGGRSMFPLLVKLIDASQNLSIQVHPDDSAAEAANKLGKTEAWYVLAAEPGAVLYVGLDEDVSFEQFQTEAAKLDGSSSAFMRTVIAIPGETVLIPAGTIHALGAGVIVYEVQQPSDITYRLDDWGRVDAEGNPREMHLDSGFPVSRPDLRPEMISPVRLEFAGGPRDLLTACRYFALERIELQTGHEVTLGRSASVSVVTVLEGQISLEEQHVAAGQSAIIWAGAEAVRMHADEGVTVLVSWVPDLETEVVQAAVNAGADPSAIAALSGETGDIPTGRPST